MRELPTVNNIIDEGIQGLVSTINDCPRFLTHASCEGHPENPDRGDLAFVTFELKEKDIRDYEFFHDLLHKGIMVSFGHDNRVVISPPWRQYDDNPSEDEKRRMNFDFVERARELFRKHMRKSM